MEKSNEKPTKKERIKYFDNIKGILIFLVVFGHMLYNVRNNSYVYSILIKIIYIFHMPAFAFISGYFSKKQIEIKKVLQYFFYYIIFNTLLMLFDKIVKDEDISLLTPYYSMWYILALIIWRVTSRYTGNIKGIIIISLVISLLIGFVSKVINIFAVSRIITFYPFFIAGYKLQKNTVESHFIKKGFWKSLIGVILFAILVIFSIKYVRTVKFEEMLMEPYKSTNGIINRIIIIMLASCFIYAILLMAQNKKIIGITKFGEKSLYIYLYHRIIVLLIPMIYPLNRGYVTTIAIFIIITLLICMILSMDFISNITEKIYGEVYKCIMNTYKKFK